MLNLPRTPSSLQDRWSSPGRRGGFPNRLGAARRDGTSNWPILAALASLVVLALLVFGLPGRRPPVQSSESSQDGAPAEPLVVYCAASNKSVMEAIRGDYEREFGVPVHVQYGPSQTLLASADVSKSGDLYLPADDSYLAIAAERGLIDDQFPLAVMQGVVAVPKGNPLGIASLADLLADDVRVCQANPDATAIGKLTREVLTQQQLWEPLQGKTAVFKTTVNDVANDVKIGSVDAGIVFNAVLHDYDSLEGIAIPELADVTSRVALAVLQSSTDPRRALHFARYMSAPDKGQVRYREYGFQPVAGDAWSDEPELVLYAGSMLRPAIEQTVQAFEEREGVHVTRVYNGCGILVAQMRAGETPDAYFACDTEFMGQVQDLFPTSNVLSQNELVILVKKGNPFGIKSLKDLAKPDLRVGIGHEKQCAMGWITQQTFQESGLQSELMKNVVVQTPTGDMLVNQMRSGSLDAAVAYLSNAAGSAEFLDAIRIQGIPCSVAHQPYGIARTSQRKRLGERLLKAIRAESSQKKFANEGFQWVDGQNAGNE